MGVVVTCEAGTKIQNFFFCHLLVVGGELAGGGLGVGRGLHFSAPGARSLVRGVWSGELGGTLPYLDSP